jgi:hypothetical protein
LADGISNSRIATPAVQPAARIHAYDVAFYQRAMIWNSVHDFVVDARACSGRKGRTAVVLVRVILEQRLGSAQAKVLRNYSVNIGRGNAGRDNLAHELMGLPDTNAGLPH